MSSSSSSPQPPPPPWHVDGSLTTLPPPLLRRHGSSSSSSTTTTDYRHLAIVRNIFKGIVSAFLYHKRGRECTVDMFGRVLTTEKERRNFQWNNPHSWSRCVLRSSSSSSWSYPPIRGRSMCDYLAQESEEDALRVLIAVGLEKWYFNLEDYAKERIQRKNNDDNRMLLVCMEEALETVMRDIQQNVTPPLFLSRTADFMYPGGGEKNAQVLERVASFNVSRFLQDLRTHKSSASSSESAAAEQDKKRLIRLARRLDEEYFGGRLHRIESLLPCP